MGNKKNRSGSGKVVAKREPAGGVEEKRTEARTEAEDKPKPKATERIQEKEPGFTVLKIVAGVIIALILGVAIVTRYYGGADANRGTLGQDERCENTPDCRSGLVCQAIANDVERCLKTCDPRDKESCHPGYTCVSSAKKMGRKKMGVTAVCVPDAKANF